MAGIYSVPPSKKHGYDRGGMQEQVSVTGGEGGQGGQGAEAVHEMYGRRIERWTVYLLVWADADKK